MNTTRKEVDRAIAHLKAAAYKYEDIRDGKHGSLVTFESDDYWANHWAATNLHCMAEQLMPNPPNPWWVRL